MLSLAGPVNMCALQEQNSQCLSSKWRSKLQCQFKKVNVEPKEVKELCSTTQGMSMTLLMLLQSRDHTVTGCGDIVKSSVCAYVAVLLHFY